MEPDDLLLFWSRLLCMVIGLVLSFMLVLILYKQNVWNQFNKLVLFVSLADCVVFPAHIILVIGFYIYEINPNSRFFLGTYSAIMVTGYMAISLSFQQSITNTYLLFYSIIMNEKKAKWCYIALTITPTLVLLCFCMEAVDADLKLFERLQLSELILQSIIIILNVILYLICVVAIRRRFGKISQSLTTTLSLCDSAILALVSRLKWYPVVQVLSRVFVLWFFAFPNHLARRATFQTPYFYSIELLSYSCTCITPIGYMILYTKLKKFNCLSIFGMDSIVNNSSNSSNSKITNSNSRTNAFIIDEKDPSSSICVNMASQSTYDSNTRTIRPSESTYDYDSDARTIRSSEETDEELFDIILRHGSTSTIENQMHL